MVSGTIVRSRTDRLAIGRAEAIDRRSARYLTIAAKTPTHTPVPGREVLRASV
jgi:hypothetical protein